MHFSQQDPAWRTIRLGTGASTIGNYGCLISSVAMALDDFDIDVGNKPPRPDTLNRWLARNGGYSKDLFIFDSLRPLGVKLATYIDARNRPLSESETALIFERDSYAFAVIQVDMTPGGSPQQHWVYVYGTNYDDLVIRDPWLPVGKHWTFLLDKYALPSWNLSRAIYRAAVYSFFNEDEMAFDVSKSPSPVQHMLDQRHEQKN